MSSLKEFMDQEFGGIKLYYPFTDNDNVEVVDLLGNLKYEEIDNDYLNRCYKEGKKLFYNMFEDNDNIFFIVNRYEKYLLKIENSEIIYDINKSFKKSSMPIKRYLKSNKSLMNLNLITEEINDKKSGLKRVYNYYIKCKTVNIDYKKLIEEIIKKDYLKKKTFLDDYYLINIDKKLIFHLCDDCILHLIYK